MTATEEQPIERLAAAELPPVSDEAHRRIYELVAEHAVELDTEQLREAA